MPIKQVVNYLFGPFMPLLKILAIARVCFFGTISITNTLERTHEQRHAHIHKHREEEKYRERGRK